MEETTSVITWFIIGIIIMATWDWPIAQTILYPTFIVFIALPMIGGFFRIQTHSCSDCKNEVKQQSIFEYLDMEDNIFSI